MFIAVPTGTNQIWDRRPCVAYIITACMIYVILVRLLTFNFSLVDSHGLADLIAIPTLAFWQQFLVSLFHPAIDSIFQILFLPFIVTFWLFFAPILEANSHWLLLLIYFFIGSLTPLLLAHFGIFGLPHFYWAGLGGTLFVVGAGYWIVRNVDIKFRYFYFVIIAYDSGETWVGTIFFLILIHFVLIFSLYHPLLPFSAQKILPGKITPIAWTLLFPLFGFLTAMIMETMVSRIYRYFGFVQYELTES